MADKRSKKPSKNVVKKKRKMAIATRRQVLSTDTLSDIFDACERFDVDNWNVVSRQCIQAIRRARPLRTVKEVTLSYDGPKKVYKTAFFFKNPDEDEDRSLLVLRDSHSYEADHVAFFFKALRFCYVDGPMDLGRWSISIDHEFVKCLKSVKGDFLFKDSLLTLGSYARDYQNHPTAEELLDALCSFPSLRALNESTFRFLRPSIYTDVNDGFLQALASRGIFEVGNVTGPPREVANGIPGRDITEHGIIDYCFGDYDDGGKGRRLHIADPQLSPQFIPKLFEACRASKSTHKLTLNVAIRQFDGAHEVVTNGRRFTGRNGLTWDLCADDVKLRILYYPPGQRNAADFQWSADYGLLTCYRN